MSKYEITAPVRSGRSDYTIDAADYTPMVVNAEGAEDTWLSVDGIIDTVKDIVMNKNFLIGGAVGIAGAILVGMLMSPKPSMGSQIGSRVRGRKRSKRHYDW